MKKILIICYGYDMDRPNNANAICLNEIIFKIAQNNKIYVITGGINSEYNVIHKNNIIVFNIPINISKKNGKKDFSSWKSKIHNFIKDEFDISKFSILFTISFPFNILQIGYSIKSTYPFLKWVIYELDPYAYNLVLRYPKSLFFIRYLMERRIFEKSDIILLTHELYKQYLQSLFSIYSSKFNDVGIPLLKIKNNNLPKINKTNEFNIE